MRPGSPSCAPGGPNPVLRLARREEHVAQIVAKLFSKQVRRAGVSSYEDRVVAIGSPSTSKTNSYSPSGGRFHCGCTPTSCRTRRHTSSKLLPPHSAPVDEPVAGPGYPSDIPHSPEAHTSLTPSQGVPQALGLSASFTQRRTRCWTEGWRSDRSPRLLRRRQIPLHIALPWRAASINGLPAPRRSALMKPPSGTQVSSESTTPSRLCRPADGSRQSPSSAPDPEWSDGDQFALWLRPMPTVPSVSCVGFQPRRPSLPRSLVNPLIALRERDVSPPIPGSPGYESGPHLDRSESPS